MAKQLERNPVHLGLGATAESEPEFTGMEWYAGYGARHASDGAEGRLVSMETFTQGWDAWEMHLNGGEVVICTAGEITLLQEIGGRVVRTRLTAGEYAINGPGVWRTADIEGSAPCSSRQEWARSIGNAETAPLRERRRVGSPFPLAQAEPAREAQGRAWCSKGDSGRGRPGAGCRRAATPASARRPSARARRRTLGARRLRALPLGPGESIGGPCLENGPPRLFSAPSSRSSSSAPTRRERMASSKSRST